MGDMPTLQDNAYLPLGLIIDSIRAEEELRVPEYDDPANAPQVSGSIVYITGAESDPEGYYRYEGGAYSELGSGSGSRPDVSDDGVVVVSEASDLNFATDLDVTDDGDGSVTIDGSASDTRTDVSEAGVLQVANVSDINFDSNMNVVDDGDGTVTVSSVDTDTDTRTNVSDDGVQVVTDVTDLNFSNNLAVTDDSDGSVTIDASGGSGGVTTVASGTLTATGGASPAFDGRLSLAVSQTTTFTMTFTPQNPAWSADYEFNDDWGHAWDDTNQHMDVNATINWDVDPGAGNDLTIDWAAKEL